MPERAGLIGKAVLAGDRGGVIVDGFGGEAGGQGGNECRRRRHTVAMTCPPAQPHRKPGAVLRLLLFRGRWGGDKYRRSGVDENPLS